MNYAAPAYGVAPAVAAGGMSTTKIIVIVVVVVSVVIILFLGAVAIALGVGLGVGLHKSSATSSRLPGPSVTCTSGVATCGCPAVKPVFQTRIINGYAAATASWPWMVYLSINNIKYCSGFLIAPQFVLTSANCVRNFGYNITLTIGTNTFPSTFGIVNITNSSILQPITLGDIAVLTLGFNVTYSASIQPCCLTSNQAQPPINDNGVIAGWGETSLQSIGTVSPTLQQAVIQVRSPSVCGVQSGNDTFCASYDSIETCPIDGGGPFMISFNNAWTCVGIITGTTGCTNPITLTRIAAYSGIIQNITGLVF
jgi:secreted trypsin-like serine protease